MNKNLRIIILLVVAVATLALLSGLWHPVQAENSVFGFTSTATTSPEEPDPAPTDGPPTVPSPTEGPPTVPSPTEQPPNTPRPTRTREGAQPPAVVDTATPQPTPEKTATLIPTKVVTPEPPETGGMMTPMTVMWVALLAGLVIVTLGQFVMRRVK